MAFGRAGAPAARLPLTSPPSDFCSHYHPTAHTHTPHKHPTLLWTVFGTANNTHKQTNHFPRYHDAQPPPTHMHQGELSSLAETCILPHACALSHRHSSTTQTLSPCLPPPSRLRECRSQEVWEGEGRARTIHPPPTFSPLSLFQTFPPTFGGGGHVPWNGARPRSRTLVWPPQLQGVTPEAFSTNGRAISPVS
jgi:hypothetical protein